MSEELNIEVVETPETPVPVVEVVEIEKPIGETVE